MNTIRTPRQIQGGYPAATRGLNFFDLDTDLQRLLGRLAPDLLPHHGERLSAFGAWVGGPLDAQADYTNRHAPPRLETHDNDGNPLGRVVNNPLYLECHREAYRRGAIGLAFGENAAPHLYSFACGYLLSSADVSIHCPVTMTGAVAYVLERLAPAAVRDAYLPDLVRLDGQAKSAGTWATEQHGGSDVGATTTRAEPAGDGWRLTGLKWFTSNAGSELALATARPAGAPAGGKGLGCYIVPMTRADGGANTVWVRRLKDKLGTRGLATGEIELDGASAVEVAGPPDGLKCMMEALEYSRIHNAVAACGVQRRAFLEAACWASHRAAFGAPILGYPMVRDTLLDMAMELEAGSALAFTAAHAFDQALADEARRPWLRLLTGLAKFRTAEQAVRAAANAVELVGGNGYTEDWPTARLFRDAMVLPVWEGPSNIQALELLRVVAGKLPGDRLFLDAVAAIVEALPAALDDAAATLRQAHADCRDALAYLRQEPQAGPRHARRLIDLLADTMGAALLLRHAAEDLAAGDTRKAIIARRYTARHFAGRAAIGPDEDAAHTAFDAILRYALVDA